MNHMTTTNTASTSDEQATNLGRFIAKRGPLIVKKMHSIGSIIDKYARSIDMKAVILRQVATGGTHSEVTYGVHLRQTDRGDKPEGSAYIDYDELDELISAIEVIGEIAARMPKPQQDYTEVIYSTRDDVQFGLFANENRQTGFVRLHYTPIFLVEIDRLQQIGRLLAQSKTYLVSKGAG